MIVHNIFLRKPLHCIRFFYKQHFISSARLELAKNEVKAKQHPIANLIFFSLTLSSKNKNRYSKKCAESKYVCLNPVNH